MAKASIPVDLFNPGQVFACLGFLEAADILLGDAEGRFDWSDEAAVRFCMRVAADENPFASVLGYLAKADLAQCTPLGFVEQQSQADDNETANEEEGTTGAGDKSATVDSYPNGKADRMSLVVRIADDRASVDLGHWADGSTRNEFKLYAGNRSAFSITKAMLYGTREKPKKKQPLGDVKTKGVLALLNEQRVAVTTDPFGVLTLMGGSFNMDPRGAWTALDAGYSPNKHQSHGVGASPIVEFMAAWGLENARPDEYETRQVRYRVWDEWLTPMLARPVLGGAPLSISLRSFRFSLDLSGKNKVVTFAQEEPVS